MLAIVLHLDRTGPETAGHDPSRAGRLGLKSALIPEKAKGHHANLSSVLDSLYWRNARPEGQKKSDERRAEPTDRGSGGHGEPRFEIAASERRFYTNYRKASEFPSFE